MSKFTYKAKDGPKKIVTGVIEANDIDSAIKKVIGLGYTPIDVFLKKKDHSIEKKLSSAELPFFLKRIPASAIALFTRQVCDLVDASVPMLRTIELVENQTKNKYLKIVVGDIYSHIKDGGSFSDALSRHKDVFSGVYIHMVQAGEVSGKLAVVLSRLADLTEKEQ